MLVTEKFFVPDYYIKFRCKGPACRHNCCADFHVDISLSDYYRLIGLACSKQLRYRLDCALKILDHPTEDRYALINHGWDGDCPLHRGDGYCALQKECGESALSAVCRYFPRSPRTTFIPECSCSNGCEEVLELLWNEAAPIRFTEKTLTFDLPDVQRSRAEDILPCYLKIRRLMIGTLQQRKYTLTQRIFMIGEQLRRLEEVVAELDYAAIQACIRQIEQVPTDPPPGHPPDGEPFQILLQLMNWLGAEYPDLTPHVHQIQAKLDRGGTASLNDACVEAVRQMPQLPQFLEQVLVNHLFYTCFPFSDQHETFLDEFAVLSTLFGLLNILVGGCLNAGSTSHDLIDLCLAFFRVVEHTSFDHNIIVLLHQNGVSDYKMPIAFLGISA